MKVQQSKILFDTYIKNCHVFFTKKGISFQYITASNKIVEKELTSYEETENSEIQFNWQHYEFFDGNKNVEVFGLDKQNNVHRFLSVRKMAANVYKKIVYKNIYPDIDFVFELPEKGGLKYSVVLRPGADPNLIQIKAADGSKIRKDKEGNLFIVKDDIFCLRDLAPNAHSLTTNEPIPVNFKVEGNTFGFNLEAINTNDSVLIDPWINWIPVRPIFNVNSAGQNLQLNIYAEFMDVRYDFDGNVYTRVTTNFKDAPGGTSPFVFQYVPNLRKYDDQGNLLWTLNLDIGIADHCNMGGMDVIRTTGTVFYSRGVQHGLTGEAIAYKISTSGVIVDSIGGLTMQDTVLEAPRVYYDECNDKVVLGCGGPNNLSLNPSQINQVAFSDSSFSYVDGKDVLNYQSNFYDVAMDPSGGYGYFLMNRAASTGPVPLSGPEIWKSVTTGVAVPNSAVCRRRVHFVCTQCLLTQWRWFK